MVTDVYLNEGMLPSTPSTRILWPTTNRSYTCVSDGVRGGILDLVPTEGAQFIQYKWNIVHACVPTT